MLNKIRQYYASANWRLLASGLIWLWIAIAVIAIDRFTKVWAMQSLLYQEPLQLLPIFNLTLTFNTGAAFSFLNSASGWQNWFLGGLALIISVAVLIWLARLPARAIWMATALCLVLGGALGNAWDRCLYGYVVDFLSFHWGAWHFAIFNIADSAIFVGAVMIFLSWFKKA